MPRMSAEARSAAAFRAGGGEYPPPPAGMSFREQEFWNAIVKSKPIDWFDPGSLPLLARYCVLTHQAEKLEEILRDTPTAEAGRVEARIIALNGNLVTIATKLRLSVQAAVDRHSRMLGEKGHGEDDPKDDGLLGGNAASWRGNLRAVG